MNLVHLLLNNWKAKMICLIIGVVLWYILRLNVPPEMPSVLPNINDSFNART